MLAEPAPQVIPRVLHRVWYGPQPVEYLRHGTLWTKLHAPAWNVVTWDETSHLPEMATRDLYDRAPAAYPGQWTRIRAALLRLELLHQFGGVVVSGGVEPLRAIDDLADGVDAFAARDRYGDHLSTAVIGAAPGHPWIADALRAITCVPDEVAASPVWLTRMVDSGYLTRAQKRHPDQVAVYDARIWCGDDQADGAYFRRHHKHRALDRKGRLDQGGQRV